MKNTHLISFALGISISFLNLAFASHVGDFVECQEAGGETKFTGKVVLELKNNNGKLLSIESEDSTLKEFSIDECSFPNTALVVIDMQDYFLNRFTSGRNQLPILTNVLSSVEKAKKRGWHIVLVRYVLGI